MICPEEGTAGSVPNQGVLILDTETGFCDVTSPYLQYLIDPEFDFQNSVPFEDLLTLEEANDFPSFLENLNQNLANQGCFSFPARLRTGDTITHCFLTAIPNPNENNAEQKKLVLFIQVENQFASMQKNESADETKECLNNIGSHVHKLNNHLTALYCQWDLVSQDITTTAENSQLIEDISETLQFFTQELRSLGTFIHSKMENQSFQ